MDHPTKGQAIRGGQLPFELTRNAFARLKVSPRAPLSQIEDAFEDAVIDNPSAESELIKIKQSITTPKPRLDGELRWLVGMAPARADEVIHALNAGDRDRIARAIAEEAEGLAAANLAADACERFHDERFLSLLIAAYREVDPAEVLAHIAGTRAASGFPAVTTAQVRDGLKTVLAEHATSAVALIAGRDHPGKLMGDVVTRHTGPIVEAIATAFAQWASPQLTALEARLTTVAEAVAQNGGGPLPDLIALLEEWDELSQPLQLHSQAKGMDDPRSLALYHVARGASLALANKHGAHADARRLTEALLRVFEELPSAKRQLSKDLTDLDAIETDRRIETDTAELNGAIKAKDNKSVQKVATRMLSYATDPGLRGQLQQVQTVARQRQSSELRQMIAWGVAIALFIVFLLVEKNSPTRETIPYAADEPSHGETAAEAADAAAAAGDAAAAAAESPSLEEPAFDETGPMAPTNSAQNSGSSSIARILSAAQIEACLAEAVRLEALEARMNTNAAIDRFNERVDQYNSKCARYQYRETDMVRAENAIALRRSKLLAEADRLAMEWAGE